VVRRYDVPYLAGSSNDDRTVYIDKRVPHRLDINGKVIDPAEPLAVHERHEHRLMRRGMDYKAAHKEATKAEKAHIRGMGVNWAEYEHVMDGYINETEHESVKDLPPDLYRKPYNACRHKRGKQ
jgi:hypothetical protein